MKTKSKQTACNLFGLRAKKYSIYQTPLVLLFVALFVSANVEAKIVINEMMLGDKDSTKNEFVELYNTGNEAVVLDGYKLMKKTENGATYSTLVSSAHFLGSIAAHGYFVIVHPQYDDEIDADLDYSSSSYSIAANNSVGLFDKNGVLLDIVGWGDAKNFETKAADEVSEGESFGRLDGEDTDDNSKDFFPLEMPSPGKENKQFIEKIKEKIVYPIGILFNEFYPKPNKGNDEKEFVELLNSSDKKVSLDGWKIIDYGKNTCVLDGKSIGAGELFFIEDDSENGCKLELNDTGSEAVELKNPDGETISVVNYTSAKEGKSYNFDGSRWRWSKFLTPGKENVLNNEPYGKIKIDDDIFENVYANFSVSTGDADGDKIKVTWDFGDGHKSYLAKTKHKFKKKGKYEGSLKMTDGSEDVSESFSVEVEKIPHPEVRIIAVNANPDGADTGLESLTIENKSKKKINLNGWSIATGWKKFVNHPINDDVEIKKGKEKEVTRKVSSFTLNNTKDKIELRYPDGKVAHEVKYKKESGVEDGEIYTKIKGGWEWVKSFAPSLSSGQKSIKSIKQEELNTESSVISNQPSETQNDEEVIMPEENVEEEVLGVEIEKPKVVVENKLVKINNDEVKIELLRSEPHVLGVETVREVDGIYFFTPQAVEHEHYAIIFFKNISSNINTKLNLLLNYFLN